MSSSFVKRWCVVLVIAIASACGDDASSSLEHQGTGGVDASSTDASEGSPATEDSSSTEGGAVDATSSDTGEPSATDTGSNAAPVAQNDVYHSAFATVLSVQPDAGVLANDADADRDELVVLMADTVSRLGAPVDVDRDGSFVYHPTDETWGADSFVYRVSDGTTFTMGVVTIHVAPGLVPAADIGDGIRGFVVDPERMQSDFGESVAFVGDFDADGYDDVAIGAPEYGDIAGRAYVVRGAPTHPDHVDTGALAGSEDGFVMTGGSVQRVGRRVDRAGDVDGDGREDLLVTAPYFQTQTGRTYVVFGTDDPASVDLDSVAAGDGGFVIDGIGPYDRTGEGAAPAGDVDGDGLDDLVIGAPYADPNGVEDAGRACVVFGKADGAPVVLAQVTQGVGGFAIDGLAPDDFAGFHVAGLGDVDGDGRDDVALGVPYSSTSGSDSGSAYVVFGKSDTEPVLLPEIEAGIGGFAMHGEAAGDFLGAEVSAAGDVNGDGLADVLVLASDHDSRGRVYVVHGRSDSTVVDLPAVATGVGGYVIDGHLASAFGFDLALVGDQNGDAVPDHAISDRLFGSSTGRVYVVFGRTDGTSVAVDALVYGDDGFVIEGPLSEFYPVSVGGDGDVNGDGLSDLVVGTAGLGGPGEGHAYVLYGVPVAP